MWRFITFITTILSLVGLVYLFQKYRQSLEDDPFYLYGDSLYRPASQAQTTDMSATAGDEMKDSEEISSMVH